MEEDIKTLEPYINGFAAGTIAVKEAFQRIIGLARLGAAVEAIGVEHDIGNAITLASPTLLLPIVRKLAQAMTDNEMEG